ncbi:MAG: hypothetical protein HYV09_19470 [Deltaproteobacteria bacterium]|nr:hypothetical protein [Deltaproteobacteria bacterium]
MIRRALAVGLVFFAAAVAPAALADGDVATARAAFEKGASLAGEGRWSDALAQFELSASLRPHATTSYNLGYCERALGHATRASKHFSAALARDQATLGGELTPELRSATKKYLAEMRAQIAMPEVTIAPADASVTVDGRPLEIGEGGHLLAGTRPSGPGENVPNATFVLEVDAGAHEIVVLGPDGRSKVAHEYFPPGSTKKVRVELPPPVKMTPTPTPTPIVDNGSRRTWGFIIGGAGLAAIGVGSYFGLRAGSTWNDAKDACPDRARCPDEQGSDLANRARAYANLSTIAFTAGAVALVGGTILVLTAPSPGKPTVSVGLGWIGATASF